MTEPLHVLITTDVVGGVWDFSRTLAAELTYAGQRVTLLAFGRPEPSHLAEADASGSQLIFEPLKLEWMRDSAADVRRAQMRTHELVRDLAVDVVQANQFVLASVPASVPIILTAHSDVLSWRKWTLGGQVRPGDEWTDYAAVVRAGLASATAPVAVTSFLAREVVSLYRLNRPVGVIHNGWPGQGRPRPLAERAPLTLLAGRAWDAAKNIDLAVRAAPGIAAGRVLFAGECRHPETGSLYRLGAGIEPLGRLAANDLASWMGQARVYLSPALYDPFGLLPLQAALAGCALLLSDIPSYRELWAGAAVFFRSGDAADLRRQWARLLADEPLAATRARLARERALARYGAPRMAADYLRMYRRLTGAAAAIPSLAGVA